MPPPFRLSLLGRICLEGPEGPIDLNNRKVCGLLAYLACGGPRSYSRERLMALLWGTHSDAQARQNLRQALHRLRSALRKSTVLSNGDQISLAADEVGCDVAEFEALCRVGNPDALRDAIAIYRGPLLSELAIAEPAWDEWVMAERERLEQMALKAMVDLATAHLAAGHTEQAIEVAGRAVTINALREDAHRVIMQSLAAAGRRAEALAHYTGLEATLRSELGSAPDAATHAIAVELHAARPPGPVLPAQPPQAARPRLNGGKAARGRVQASSKVVAAGLPPSAARTGISPRRRWLLGFGLPAAGCLLLGAVALVAMRPWSDEPIPAWASEIAQRRNDYRIPIGVLPVRLLSPQSAAAAAFAEHVEEEVTNYLSYYPILSVPPRQAMRDSRKLDKPLSYWSKAGLRYAVGGSVWADQQTLRLSVHVIDPATQLQVWAKHFEYPLQEWPSQREVALRRIAGGVNFVVVRREGGKPFAEADKPTVQELLARGWRGLVANADSGEFARAGAYFAEVLERDASSVSAMVGLAGHKLLSTSNLLGEREAQVSEAEALLRKAMDKGADTFTLHFYLGILYNLKNDAATALAEFDRAVALNPAFGAGHAFRGRVLIKLSRYTEALESVRYAHHLTEGSLAAGWALWRAIALLELGEDQGAGDAFRYALQMQPQNPYFIAGAAAFCALSGDWAMARRHVVELRAGTPGHTDAWRLWEMNKGPGDQPLPNRLGEGLRLALDAVPES